MLPSTSGRNSRGAVAGDEGRRRLEGDVEADRRLVVLPASSQREHTAAVPGHERPSSARAILLLLLAENPQHGYELQPQIVQLMGTSYNGAGMYRGLRKLEEEGLVTSSWGPAPTPGPARRNYCLTAAGRVELEVHVHQLKRSARQIRMFLRRHGALHDRE